MDPLSLVPALIDGKYRVESTLGEGGMGLVLRARHLELDQPVAIKVLRFGSGAIWHERFLREARAASRIPSDHVVRVYDVGRLLNGLPYMVMELLEGRDLSDVVYGDGPLEVDEAVGYVLQACEALAAAHARGIVHRDVKPANLFLTARDDGSEILKLLDFGISKEAFAASEKPSTLTRTDAVLGSPLFMSPEQLACSRDVDHRADIWSLGVTLYELLSAEHPFPGESVAELYSAILRDAPCPLRQHRPDVPQALEAVVLRCLAKLPDERYPSVVDLAEALAPFAPDASELTLSRLHELSRPPSEPDSLFDIDWAKTLVSSSISDERPPSSRAPTTVLEKEELERLEEQDMTPGATVRPTVRETSVAPPPGRRLGLFLGAALGFGTLLGAGLVTALWPQREPLTLSPPPQVVVTTAALASSQPAPSASGSGLASPFADSALLSDGDRARLRKQLAAAKTDLAQGKHDSAASTVDKLMRELRDRGVRPNKTVSALGAQSQLVLGRVEAARVRALLIDSLTREEAEQLDGRLVRQLAHARKTYDDVRVWGVRSLFRCALTEMADLDLAAGDLFLRAASESPPQSRKWYAERARTHLRHARTGFRAALEVLAETSLCSEEAQAGKRKTRAALDALSGLRIEG